MSGMPGSCSPRRRSTLWWIVLALALFAAAVLTWWLDNRAGPDAVTNTATFVAIISAGASIVAAAIAVLGYRRDRQNSSATPQEYKKRLAELIQEEVGTEIGLLGLAGTDYLQVDWELHPRFSTAETRQRFGGTGTVVKTTKPRDVSVLAED